MRVDSITPSTDYLTRKLIRAMPIFFGCPDLSLTSSDADLLWRKTIENQHYADDMVTVKCVDISEITNLNVRYRKKNKATNVLTFSYGEGEHDIAICPDVVKKEALARGSNERDYAALVLVHALLHVTGLDHESSREESKTMQDAERKILGESGFAVNNL